MTGILLTGFEAFEDRVANGSWEAVRRVPGLIDNVHSACLPVVFVKAAEELRRLISVHNPDVVIAVGEAPGRSAVSIERVALNLMNARIPDATGYQPRDEPVDAPAPNALWTGLPVYACLTAAQQTPGKTELSYSAGTFVCNDVFYRLMNSPEARGRRAGFVHVPTVDMMPSEQTSRALAAIATAALHDEEIEGFAEGGTIA